MVQETDRADTAWPIVDAKDHDGASVFKPEALLREARRQRSLKTVAVPEVCVLDPDGDVVRYLKRTGAGRPHEGWACYHTELIAFELEGVGEVGIVGCAVGAPFAVLVAEQLFASGCRLLVSVTSAGQINPIGPTPYFVLIEPGAARRGHQLSLSAWLDLRGGAGPVASGPHRAGRAFASREAASGLDVDDGRTVS